MSTKNLAIALICLFAFNACKKSSSSSDSDLLHGTWLNTYFMRNYTSPGTAQVDMLGTSPTCSKDNLLVLKADKTYEFNEGAVKCYPNNPAVLESGTFQVTGNNEKLSLSSGWTVDITELTSTTLKMKYTTNGTTGNQYYDIITYTRQ